MENSNNSISNNSPSHFCTTDRTNFVTISENNLVVTYHGQGNHSHDVGAVRANAPFPHDNIIHYFEVKILSVGARRSIALGMANGDFSLNRYPGCEQGSYGYHGDDGRCYVDGGRGEPYGPRFGSDDVVGCGVHVEQGELFFTRNGRLLPPAASNVRGTLFAVVGLHSAGESVAINFGAQPFRFDLNEMIQEKKKTHQDRIARVKLNSSAVRNIVQCYLQHAGYEATLQALDGALPPDVRSTGASACTNNTITTKTTATSTTTTSSTSTTNSSSSCKQSGNTERTLAASLGARSQLRTAIERGCIETEALPFLRQQWPALFECSWFGASLARLRCQSLIEMVRDGHIAEALSFARTELAPLRQTDASWRTAVDQVAPLLAYPAPHQSPLSHLLAPTRRRRLADEINRCVIALETNQTPADCMSSFELIVRHGRVAEQVRNSAVK